MFRKFWEDVKNFVRNHKVVSIVTVVVYLFNACIALAVVGLTVNEIKSNQRYNEEYETSYDDYEDSYNDRERVTTSERTVPDDGLSAQTGRATAVPATQQPEQTAVPVEVNASDSILPDPGDFLNCRRGEDKEHRSYGSNGRLVSYSFDLDKGKNAIPEFMDLIRDERYQLSLKESTEEDYKSTSAMLIRSYFFKYTGSKSNIGIVKNSDGKSRHVIVSVIYYYDRGRILLTMYYGDGLSLVSSGANVTTPVTDYNGGSSDSGSSDSGSSDSGSSSGGSHERYVPDASKLECTICDGTGDCPRCGGDGYVYSYAVDKEDFINCSKCGGDGKCYVCHGTGKRE